MWVPQQHSTQRMPKQAGRLGEKWRGVKRVGGSWIAEVTVGLKDEKRLPDLAAFVAKRRQAGRGRQLLSGPFVLTPEGAGSAAHAVDS